MNRKQVLANMPVLRAFAEGKIVQYQSRPRGGEWYTIKDDCTFNFDLYDYRVKPEPKRFYRVLNANNSIYLETPDEVRAVKACAERNHDGSYKPYKIEEYVQVIK